ncbi:MAG: diacylglycerol/lipid kinase family protein [Chthoniobacterales bacterium]|jgi:diacylglycerol kinase family enzyme
MKLIVNASAGTAARDLEEVRAACAAAGLQIDIVSATADEKIGAVVRRAIAESDAAVVAAGGDGTISAVASELAGSGRTLGVLPLGTLNHFAKDLGIPMDLEGAARVIAAGRTVEVDVAEVNGATFINNSSLGIYPQIVSKREAQQERLARGKWPAFVWATMHALRRFPFLTLRVTLEHEQLTRRTAFLFVGNNEYEISGFRIGARAALDRGQLGLYLTHRTGRVGLLRLALRALFHRLEQAKDFEVYRVTEVTIESRRERLLVARDGEVEWIRTPLHYRTRPRALKVFAPANE